MNFEAVSENQPEKESDFPSLRVFSVRHGDTLYLEQIRGDVKDDEIDLTEKGVAQITSAAEKIAQRIDKSDSIVWVIGSPRKRTRDSAEIIRTYLRDNGFQVHDDVKQREDHDRVRSVDVLDEEQAAIDPKDPKYVEKIAEVMASFPQGVVPTQYVTLNKVSGLEPSVDVRKRATSQLAYLMRIAHTIQPGSKKQIIIVQTEHEETMDPVFEEASEGRFTVKKVTGAQKGEVIELSIPVQGDEIGIDFIDRDEKATIKFDYLKRRFGSQENSQPA